MDVVDFLKDEARPRKRCMICDNARVEEINTDSRAFLESAARGDHRVSVHGFHSRFLAKKYGGAWRDPRTWKDHVTLCLGLELPSGR